MLDLADRVNGTFKSGIGRALLLSAAGVFMYACGGDALPVNTSTSPPENNRPVAASTSTYTPEPTYNPPATSTSEPSPTPDLEDNVTHTVEPSPTPYPMETPTITPTSKPRPTPEPSPTPEPTFRDYAIERLQEYHDTNPSKVYSSQSLDRMLNFIGTNESLVSDYDGRNFHILTTFLEDNPDAVQHIPAVDQYVREIDGMIFDYVNIQDLDKKIEGYGDVKYNRDISVRDMINLNWSNFLPFIESGHAKDGEYIFLYPAIFNVDMIDRIIEYEVDPDRYNHNVKELRPNLVEVAYNNITNFQEIRDTALKVAESPDYIAEAYNDGKKTNEYVLVVNLGKRVWTNSAEQAEHDITSLLNEGSTKAKTALRIYAYNETPFGNNSRFPESRVELAIGDLWTLPEYGIRAYRMGASGHGELAFDITESDLELMMKISNEEFLVLPSPYGGMSTNIQWTRTERAIKDGIDKIRWANYEEGSWQTLIELK